ncbi:fimbrial protein [Aeromonas sobria]|nr:fimbrial protein [Aeromonas sobria]
MVAAVSVIWVISSGVMAATTANGTILVKAEFEVAPCIINQGQPVDVDFGDVPIDELGDPTLEQVVGLSVQCSEAKPLEWKIEGVPDQQDPTQLASSLTDVGFLFSVAGQAVSINTYFPWDPTSSELRVRPTATGVAPGFGGGTATATLLVRYQ